MVTIHEAAARAGYCSMASLILRVPGTVAHGMDVLHSTKGFPRPLLNTPDLQGRVRAAIYVQASWLAGSSWAGPPPS